MQQIKIHINICILFLFVSSGINCSEQPEISTLDKYYEERKKMVEEQVRSRGITDEEILDAFLKVKRHKFVPIKYKEYAYLDRPLPIGKGQTISQPYIVAYMIDLINLSDSDKVLEIGTGSGYQAAILGVLCDSVYTIEIFESLAKEAKNRLKKAGYSNVKVKTGDGYKGWNKYAPYDAIIVSCAPSEVPPPLKDQLKMEGKIVIPVDKEYGQKIVLVEKNRKGFEKKEKLPVRFVPMIDSLGKDY